MLERPALKNRQESRLEHRLTARLCRGLAAGALECAAISLTCPLCIFLSVCNRFLFFLWKKAFPRCFRVRCTDEEAGKRKLTERTSLGSVRRQPAGCCFLILQCLNKVRMQEEVLKDLTYLTRVCLYTIPDKGLWEIYVLICKNESFSNCFRLARSFLNRHVPSESPFLYFWKFGNDCLQRKPPGKLVFKLGSVALRLDVHIGVWVYQQLKNSKHRKAILLAYSQKSVNTFTDSV